MQKKLIDIVTKIKNLSLYQPLSKAEIVLVERELNIRLPKDFVYINLICSYEFIGPFDWYNFGDKEGVIEVTKSWRKNIKLPNNCLVLLDDGTSAILMSIKNSTSNIIWCALEDVLNLCHGQAMEYNPTIFPTFTDFYEFLLDEEEKIRAEGQEE